jgi:hypothetical protein
MMTPTELAAELGISAKTLRAWLRKHYPRPAHEHGSDWQVPDQAVTSARERWAASRQPQRSSPTTRAAVPRRAAGRARLGSDEAYVLGLVSKLLDEQPMLQHRFDWLVGDANASGNRARLPVDAFFPKANLVVEYRERQHEEAVAFFDKPDRMTVSGVHRGEQRRMYDKRREIEIPRHGIRLLIVTPGDLDSDGRGRLRRSPGSDSLGIAKLLCDQGVRPSGVRGAVD